MKPAPFQLLRPRTVDEAVGELSRLAADPEAEAKIIAGGQSLVPMMNFRLARPTHLVDLALIDELTELSIDDDVVIIGAMVTQARCLADSSVATLVPLLTAALDHIGHGQIRNRGTIGGSVAHADPAAELPTVLVALDAEVEVVGPSGRRQVPAAELFDGWLTTTLADDELLTAVRVPVMAGVEWGFEELSRRHGDFAMVLAATVVRRRGGVGDPSGEVTDARIVLGGVGPTPVRAVEAERTLVGTAGVDGFEAAAAAAGRGLEPTDDVHADRAYRLEMVEVLVKRCLTGTGPSSRPAAEADRSAPRPDPDTEPQPGTVVVNGDPVPLRNAPDRLLLADWLRDHQDLTGTHLGCEHGVCGACTVLVDDVPVRSCLMFAAQVDGHRVTTIESLGTPTDLHPVQEAFRAKHGLQCGYCTPGMVLTTVDLLARHPDPDEDTIRRELSGNICRCTGYVKIVDSVREAAVRLRSTDRP